MAAFIFFGGTLLFYLIEPFSKALPIPAWRHRHALVNSSVALINLAVLAAVGLGTSILVDQYTAGPTGLKRILTESGLPPLAVTAALILLYDAVNYWIHRSQHMFDVLWPLHRVHHSDPYLDVTSAFRFHPFESIYRAAIQAGTIVAFGMTPELISVYLVFAVCALLFSHTNTKLPDSLDRTLAMLLVTPDMHRVHHSKERRFHDSNFGIVFSLWDRIFRTFTPAASVPDLEIGLHEYFSAETMTVSDVLSDPVSSIKRSL